MIRSESGLFIPDHSVEGLPTISKPRANEIAEATGLIEQTKPAGPAPLPRHLRRHLIAEERRRQRRNAKRVIRILARANAVADRLGMARDPEPTRALPEASEESPLKFVRLLPR